MPKWSSTIPKDPKGPALPIKRTPAFKKLTAVVTTENLIGTMTHYFKGRTKPCELPDCEACRAGIPYRWHAYLAAEEVSTALHFIFETTAMGAEGFIDYRKAHGTIRGCLFEAARWKQRPNGRILLRMKPADLGQRRLPQGPDLIKCLSILWDLPSNDLHTTIGTPEHAMPGLTQSPDKGNSPCAP